MPLDTVGAKLLLKLLAQNKITHADIASVRNSHLAQRPMTEARRKANAENAKKTAGVPRPGKRKPASTQGKSPLTKKK